MSTQNVIVGGRRRAVVPAGDPGPEVFDPSCDPGSVRQCVPGTLQKPGTLRNGLCAGAICLALVGMGLRLWTEQVSPRDYARVERDTCPVSSRVDGTIAKIFVSNGQMVKAGDLLVEMDRRELEGQRAAAHAEVNQARATLEAIAERLARTQPELEQTALLMDRCERELDARLLDDEASPGGQSKDRARLSRSRAVRTAYAAALNRYSEQKATLERVISRVQRDQDQRQAVAATLRTAEASVEQTNRRLEDTRVYAAVTGCVAFDKSKVVQRLQAGEVFLSLLGEPRLVAQLAARQRKRCRLGQQVLIQIEAIQGRTFQGKIESIAPVVRGSGDRAPARWLAVALLRPLQTAQVTIRFETDSILGFEERLDPGLPCSVEVIPRNLKVGT